MSGKSKRDDSYFAASRRRNKKYMMIIIPIVAAVAVAGVAAAVLAPRPPDLGVISAEHHKHAVFEVMVQGQAIDFSQDRYQVRSQYIHVEGGDGTTLHRHSSKAPLGEFFRSVGMNVENDCIALDNGQRLCEDGTNQLRFYVNGTEQQSPMDYILQDNDRILVIYGNESQEQIQAEIERLNQTPVNK